MPWKSWQLHQGWEYSNHGFKSEDKASAPWILLEVGIWHSQAHLIFGVTWQCTDFHVSLNTAAWQNQTQGLWKWHPRGSALPGHAQEFIQSEGGILSGLWVPHQVQLSWPHQTCWEMDNDKKVAGSRTGLAFGLDWRSATTYQMCCCSRFKLMSSYAKQEQKRSSTWGQNQG